jgi:hypothetical protein
MKMRAIPASNVDGFVLKSFIGGALQAGKSEESAIERGAIGSQCLGRWV